MLGIVLRGRRGNRAALCFFVAVLMGSPLLRPAVAQTDVAGLCGGDRQLTPEGETPIEWSEAASEEDIQRRMRQIASAIERNRNGIRYAIDEAFRNTYGRAPTTSEYETALDSLRNVEVLPTDPFRESSVAARAYPEKSPPTIEVYQDQYRPYDRADQLSTAVHEFTHVLSFLFIPPDADEAHLPEEDDQWIMQLIKEHYLSRGMCEESAGPWPVSGDKEGVADDEPEGEAKQAGASDCTSEAVGQGSGFAGKVAEGFAILGRDFRCFNSSEGLGR